MNLGLCMVVRDEEHNLPACLDPIVDLFTEVVVVDTGSRDSTRALLRQRYGIVPAEYPLCPTRCGGIIDARNAGLASMSAPWIMSLDADERISRSALQDFTRLSDDPEVSGYFFRWMNRIPGDVEFEDYKLFVFRNGLRMRGLVHENVSIDLRDRRLAARWHDGIDVHHLPRWVPAERRALRMNRLRCALEQEPRWYRYHWFLGYTMSLTGRMDEAIHHLQVASSSLSLRFPVEVLNSSILLADIAARAGDGPQTIAILERALDFHRQVATDFEVQINFRLRPWLEEAWRRARRGQLQSIQA
ncbi:MAG: glycosyltransferase [Chromatiaceae bacterium]|nr:MAG: glycosyltransferase [Chromatiaceae bacterium]